MDQSNAQTGSSSTAADDDPKHKLQRTEAVLVLSRGPLASRKLALLAGLADATEARTLIRQLNQLYDETNRAFRAEEVAGGYQLLTRPQFAPYLRRLGHVPQTVRLSSPMLETLAIVAYHQPVLRANIEAIRGVQSGELLRQLMERDLVRISGRSEELGRPYLYSTTKQFLQVFGLRNIDALPCTDWFDQSSDRVPVSDSSDKESDVSIAIASGNLDSADSSDNAIAVLPANEIALDAQSDSEIDDEEDDDWDDEEEDDDWDDEDDGEWEEESDEESDEEYDEDDDQWEEVGDEDDDEDDVEVEGDEDDEWDDDEEDYEDADEEDGEWVDDEDEDDWGDDDDEV